MAHTVLDSADLANLFSAALVELKAHAATVDQLNVFPVPDGDTGKNMTLTWEGGVASLENTDAPVGESMKTFSRGTLMAARGNSGVILSQFVRGFAEGVRGKETLTVDDFAVAFERGVSRSYTAVGSPVEGTMLTVMREAGEAVRDTHFDSFDAYFSALTEAMRDSLAHTPDLLPVLKDAGVVDSGGAGLSYLFEGMRRREVGDTVAETPTDFVTAVTKVNTERVSSEHVRYAVVAVASGDGIGAYFQDIGVSVLIDGGQTNNPPADAFLEAFRHLDADYIVVLPNDGNVLMTARQAAELYTDADVRVIATKSLAEGYSALSMMDLSRPTVEDVIDEMTHYLPNVTTGYVTTATRDAHINGVAVKQGHYIGLTPDAIYADATDKVEAALALFEALPDIDDKQVITGFTGADVSPEEQDRLTDAVTARWPMVEIGFVPGGQAVYSFIFAIE